MAICESWQYDLNCWNPVLVDGMICDDCYRKIQTEGLTRRDRRAKKKGKGKDADV